MDNGLLILIGIVIAAGIAIYILTAPKFKITFSDGSKEYTDSSVRVSFHLDEVSNLRNLISVPFEIKNLGSTPISIDWDHSSFVDPNGNSQRVIHSGIKLIDKSAAQAPSVVASRSKFQDQMTPADNIYWWNGTKDTAGKWMYHALLMKWKGQPEFGFKILLSLKIEGEAKPHEFDFKAVKA